MATATTNPTPHQPRTSARKVESNRRNASKSTGPRTTQGKARSRLNAMKHGILASQTVIATIEGRPDRKLFEQTVEGLTADFQPVGTYEQLLVQEIAACFWRKRRLLKFENRAAFDVYEKPAFKVLNEPLNHEVLREPLYTEGGNLTTAAQIYEHAGLDDITLPSEADTMRIVRYEAAVNRTRERAVKSLREMQDARRGVATGSREKVAPAVDRIAARRNATSAQGKILPLFMSTQVWQKISDIFEEAAEAEARKPENYQTKPKKVITDEIIQDMVERIKRDLSGGGQPKEPENDSNKPPTE